MQFRACNYGELHVSLVKQKRENFIAEKGKLEGTVYKQKVHWENLEGLSMVTFHWLSCNNMSLICCHESSSKS